jgi:hypothetical protein
MLAGAETIIDGEDVVVISGEVGGLEGVYTSPGVEVEGALVVGMLAGAETIIDGEDVVVISGEVGGLEGVYTSPGVEVEGALVGAFVSETEEADVRGVGAIVIPAEGRMEGAAETAGKGEVFQLHEGETKQTPFTHTALGLQHD